MSANWISYKWLSAVTIMVYISVTISAKRREIENDESNIILFSRAIEASNDRTFQIRL